MAEVTDYRGTPPGEAEPETVAAVPGSVSATVRPPTCGGCETVTAVTGERVLDAAPKGVSVTAPTPGGAQRARQGLKAHLEAHPGLC